MISVKLFTDKRVWRRKYDEIGDQASVYIWDDYGEFLEKKKTKPEQGNLEKNGSDSFPSKKTTLLLDNDETLSRWSDHTNNAQATTTTDGNRFAKARLHVMIAVGTTTQRNRDKYLQNSAILRKKRNQIGHIILRTYQCAISVLLQNIVQRLNDENFNIYENDDKDDEGKPLFHKRDQTAWWYALPNVQPVTEALIRNHFYLLLTPRRGTVANLTTTMLPINACDLNTFIDLRDLSRDYIDVRDDQEIHIRPVECFLPVDVLFAGEHGIYGLYYTTPPGSDSDEDSNINSQRIDHRGVLYIKFMATSQPHEMGEMLSQLCQGIALTNWYDYDLCLGKRQHPAQSEAFGGYTIPNDTDDNANWHCGIRAPLAQALKKHPLGWHEWTWIDTEVRRAMFFGKIDFFYWNTLFLRKRAAIYDNPLNNARLNTPHFIKNHSLRDIQGYLLDLCFDCWNFTNNLGEMVCLLSYPGKGSADKKKTGKYPTPWLLNTIGAIINDKRTEQAKNEMSLVDDYASQIVECLLLRINEEFVTESGKKTATSIPIDRVFRDNDQKAAGSSTNAALRIASTCWLNLRSAVRMIEAIRLREVLQQRWINTDFEGRLLGCAKQLISISWLLSFSGLANFSLISILSINWHLHLCMLLNNGDRLIANPLDKTYCALDDKVYANLYMNANYDSKLPRSGLQTDDNTTLFISALDEAVQKRSLGKPVVEKYIKQPVFIKSSVKKNKLPKLFSSSKVEYIAFDVGQTTEIAHFPRDRFIKRIHIEEEGAAPHLLRLTLSDPDGRFDDISQIAILLDEIHLVNSRKKIVNSLVTGTPTGSPVAELSTRNRHGDNEYCVPVSKRTIFDVKKTLPVSEDKARCGAGDYCVPVSKRTIFDVKKTLPVSDGQGLTGANNDDKADCQRPYADVAAKTEAENKHNAPLTCVINQQIIRGAGLEEKKMASDRSVVAFFDKVYHTLLSIATLLEEEDNAADADMASVRRLVNSEKINAAYHYFKENYQKRDGKQAMLDHIWALIDDVSTLSITLIALKRYETYEKVRTLCLELL